MTTILLCWQCPWETTNTYNHQPALDPTPTSRPRGVAFPKCSRRTLLGAFDTASTTISATTTYTLTLWHSLSMIMQRVKSDVVIHTKGLNGVTTVFLIFLFLQPLHLLLLILLLLLLLTPPSPQFPLMLILLLVALQPLVLQLLLLVL